MDCLRDYIGSLLSATNIPLVGIQDIDEHMRRRRPWARGLSTSASKAYQPLIAKRTRQLANRLEGQSGVFSLEYWFDWFSFVFLHYVVAARQDLTFWNVSQVLSHARHGVRKPISSSPRRMCLTLKARFGGGSNQLRDRDADKFRRILNDGMT